MSLKQLDDHKWLVRVYNPHGREHRKVIKGKRAAIAHERMMKARLSNGESRLEAMSRTRFSEYAQQWIDSRNVKPITRSGYHRLLHVYTLPYMDDLRIGDWRHSDAQRFANQLSASGHAPSTQRRVHTLVRAVFLAAVRDELLNRNPFDGVNLPPARRLDREPVGWDDVAAMYASAGKAGQLAVILAATGLRAGELCALSWEDVDLAEGVVKVRRSLVSIDPRQARAANAAMVTYISEPKSHAAVRDIPIPPALKPFLRPPKRRRWVSLPSWPSGRLERLSLVLDPPRAEIVVPTNLSSRIARAARHRGLVKQSPHDYRRLYAATLEQAGVPLATVQQVLGHAPSGVTMTHYVSVQPHTIEMVRNVIEQALTGILSE